MTKREAENDIKMGDYLIYTNRWPPYCPRLVIVSARRYQDGYLLVRWASADPDSYSFSVSPDGVEKVDEEEVALFVLAQLGEPDV